MCSPLPPCRAPERVAGDTVHGTDKKFKRPFGTIPSGAPQRHPPAATPCPQPDRPTARRYRPPDAPRRWAESGPAEPGQAAQERGGATRSALGRRPREVRPRRIASNWVPHVERCATHFDWAHIIDETTHDVMSLDDPVASCVASTGRGQGNQEPVVASGAVEEPAHPHRRAHGHELVGQRLPAAQSGSVA